MEKEELIEKAHILLHPIRYGLVQLLRNGEKHLSDLARAVGEDRQLIGFHLGTLEEYGFVTSRYEISENPKSRGKAIRIYTMTGKVDEVIGQFIKVLEERK